MPSGIILSSGSHGATEEAVQKVLADHGFEVEATTAAAAEPELVEPKRDDFASDEEFETAQEEFEVKQEEAERAAEEKEDQEEAERERKEKERRAAAGKKPSRRERAVERATRELQEQNRKLQERLEALEGKKAAAAAAAEEIKAPQRADFKSDEEFEEAKFDYRYKLRRLKEQSEASKQQLESRLKENFDSYQAQVAAFKEEHDDWDEVVNQPIPVHESVYLAVQEQENGAQVTYYLGKHPAYAKRLAEMSPLSAVMEIGRLAERLKPRASEPGANRSGTPRKTPPKTVPEPVRPVSTAATSSTLSSREAADKRDFRAFKAAQRRGA